MGATHHRVSNSRVPNKIAAKYQRKYARDIKYLNREHIVEERIYENHKKQSIVEPDEPKVAKEHKSDLHPGKRYFITYAIIDDKFLSETIAGECVWSRGEYFMIKDGHGTKTLRLKYVRRIKEII